MKGLIHKTMMGWHIISEDIDMFPINGIPVDKQQAKRDLNLSNIGQEVEFEVIEQIFEVEDWIYKNERYEPKTIITYRAIII